MRESLNWRANLPSKDRVSFGTDVWAGDASPGRALELSFMRLPFFWFRGASTPGRKQDFHDGSLVEACTNLQRWGSVNGHIVWPKDCRRRDAHRPTAPGTTWCASSASRQPANHWLAMIQNSRSASTRGGCGCRRWRTTSCCRDRPRHPSYHRSLPLLWLRRELSIPSDQ